MAKGSPNRRKSIAFANQNVRPDAPARRRRAHSLAPGEKLSPAAKARRLLMPRKSILKTTINIPSGLIGPLNETIASEDATASMDMTQTDFHAPVPLHDNTARKSLGRRVSFAEHAHVRMFEVQNQNTNSTGSPQSSPSVGGSSPPGQSNPPVNDENAYPGSQARRRSSIRRSWGEESMDMDYDDTAPLPEAFLNGDGLIQDEVFTDDEEGDDMEMTDIIGGALLHRRQSGRASISRRRSSVAPAASRTPLSEVSGPSSESSARAAVEEGDNTVDSNSASESSRSYAEEAPPIEYEVPLARALNPPEKNEAWLALRAVTHSGDTVPSPEPDDDGVGMELTDAMERLMKVRESLGIPATSEQHEEDNTFTSTEDSFENGDSGEGSGDQTVNVTGLLRRQSEGGRPVAGTSSEPADSTMDITTVYDIVAEDVSVNRSIQAVSVPTETSPSTSPIRPTVFQPQPSNGVNALPAATQRPASPSKVPAVAQATVPKPFQFSFTPQSQNPTRSTPGSVSPAKTRPTAAFAPPVAKRSPVKRPLTSSTVNGEEISSPRKKPEDGTRKPRALSPSKLAPFEGSSSSHNGPTQLKTQTLRRPSGYFAQRKSLGRLGSNAVDIPAVPPAKNSGRASVGTVGTNDAWMRFDPSISNVDPVEEHDNTGRDVPSEAEKEHRVPSPAPRSRTPIVLSSPQRVSSPERAVDHLSGAQFHDEDVNVIDEVVTDAAGFQVGSSHDMTEQWRAGLQGQTFEDDEGPVISIEQFFALTGIRFMDEITAPRRSIHPSQLQPRRSSTGDPNSTIGLSEYAVAMSVDVPQLVLYSRVAQDLQAWIDRSRGICGQAEEEALKMTPELFREYAAADEEGQAELLHQLKLIKAHMHSVARGEWYDWRMDWVQQLYATAEKGFSELEADARVIEDITNQAREILPSLRDEYEKVMRELEQEQAEVAEIESGDQEFLSELKASIAEQSMEVEALKAEVSEARGKLGRLQEKLVDIEADKHETNTAINNAKRIVHLKNNSTLAEVERKQHELTASEKLHGFRATTVRHDLFEFIHAEEYRVTVPCINFKPLLAQVQICRFEGANRVKDMLPRLTDLTSKMAIKRIAQLQQIKGTVKCRDIVQRLRDYWSSISQLRFQLEFLSIKFPIAIEPLSSAADCSMGFKAVASLLFPAVKGKALISYIFDMQTYSSWPMSIASVGCEVEIVYGPLDRDIILGAVQQRMAQATPAYNHAYLLDASIEGLESIS